jgi:phytoene dehydrogenase-like protein
MDVVVVGGGIAGIATALGAAKAGLKVTLVERRPTLGGRARSWKDPTTGDPVAIGPHVVTAPDYVNFFRLLEELGTRENLAWLPEDSGFLPLVIEDRMTILRADAPFPPPFNWLPSLLRDPDVQFKDIHSTVPVLAFALSQTEEQLLELDQESGLAVLRRFGVTEFFIQHFWAFTAHAILNVPLE